ncbi:MAG: transposase [Synechococcus sp.]
MLSQVFVNLLPDSLSLPLAKVLIHRLVRRQIVRHHFPFSLQISSKKRRLWGHWLYLAALKLDDGSLLVIATQTAPQSAITDYAQRWGIETLFGRLKTCGFRMEDSHLRDCEHLSKLFALLALALV